MFQSHLGSILPSVVPAGKAIVADVSIPPWFDFAFEPPLPAKPAASVSIPPWFDFASEAAQRHALPRCRFQSHLGSILPDQRERVRRDFGLFQSHLGSILPNPAHHTTPSFLRVSIPPWFDFAAHLDREVLPASPAFQSHLGSILPACAPTAQGTAHAVSIPPWFDFADPVVYVGGPVRCCFNPTLVRFCLYIFRAHLPRVRRFNPTLVRFCLGRVGTVM